MHSHLCEEILYHDGWVINIVCSNTRLDKSPNSNTIENTQKLKPYHLK